MRLPPNRPAILLIAAHSTTQRRGPSIASMAREGCGGQCDEEDRSLISQRPVSMISSDLLPCVEAPCRIA